MEQAQSQITYRHTPDMGEISGMGGSYENACQDMLEAGVKFIEAKKLGAADLKISDSPQIFGICFPENQPAKELSDAVLAAVDDSTGAMHHAVMRRLYVIAKNGWEWYCGECRKYNAEKTK